jgi:hypothetical protein
VWPPEFTSTAPTVGRVRTERLIAFVAADAAVVVALDAGVAV